MIETDFTSDVLIFNILRESDDEFINAFNIKFIDKSVPAMEDNTIYVANLDLEPQRETFNSIMYSALTNVYIKTKNTDYVEASRILRTVAKHIKTVLKTNVTCKQRHITFRNQTYEYGSNYTLQGLHLIISMNELEILNDTENPDLIENFELDTEVIIDGKEE